MEIFPLRTPVSSPATIIQSVRAIITAVTEAINDLRSVLLFLKWQLITFDDQFILVFLDSNKKWK